MVKMVKPVPCQHIADYYQFQWLQNPCIAYNVLRNGYRQWAEGRLTYSRINTLYGKAPKPYRPTVKQILTRDFNWRMGNLRRLQMSTHGLDIELACMIQRATEIQASREIERHQLRLKAEEINYPPIDYIHAKARQGAHR